MQRLGDAESFERVTAELEAQRQGRDSAGLTLTTPEIIECPRCNGAEFLRYDVAVDDPRFGEMVPCPDCKAGRLEAQRRSALLGKSGIEQHADLRFSALVPRTGQERAWEELQAFAREPVGCKWLFGPTRAGKTTLAVMTGNAMLDLNRQVIFRMVGELMDQIYKVISDKSGSLADAMDLVKTADVLILDEYGRQSPGEATTARLFQILNQRMFERRPMIVTTNRSLDQLDEALRGRVLDDRLCTTIEVHKPDRVGRTRATRDAGR
jgi:chromosomal replication initiation ATPase DnaA